MTWECSRVCFSRSTEHPKEEYAEVLWYLHGMSGPQGGLAPFISTKDVWCLTALGQSFSN